MHKAKLQEYCHSKSWKLPEYSSMKEGLDHCPQFKATVIVNGSEYSTPGLCKSSKEAQNNAAMIAFNHLTGSLSASSSSPVRPACSDVQQPQTNETPCVASLSETPSTNRDHKKFNDFSHLYKIQLQNYAQKKNLLLPMYISEHEGPPHACRFKSKVTLDGKTYESHEYFNTIKEAENAAAKVAFMAASDGIEEEDPSFYKNLLQELAQKAYSCLPVYNTTSSGTLHMPKFISTVEIKDESFIGRESKTKKLAEMDAAKFAYAALKECSQKQNSVPSSPESHIKNLAHCSSLKEQSIAVAESLQGKIPESVLKSSENSAEQARCTRGTNQEPETNTFAARDTCKNISTKSPTASVPSLSKSDVKANNERPTGPSCKKVKVYPHTPNMIFPPGTTIMRIDDKWVAVTDSD